MGRGPPGLSGTRPQGPAEDPGGAEGVRGADGTGRQRGAAPALQAGVDVEPVLPAGGVHRDGHAVRREGEHILCSEPLIFNKIKAFIS